MILPMDNSSALQIATWEYEGMYSVYNHKSDPNVLRELMNGQYYRSVRENGYLAGFYCFGPSARIPTREEDDDAAFCLDIGLGLPPGDCGKGLGAAFVREGLAFARSAFQAETFRLTVAAFNGRAIRVYQSVGFREIRSVTHLKSGMPFLVMSLESP